MTSKKKRIDWLNHGLEFLVVITGILIAFQLNQCSSDRKQDKTLVIHLEHVYDETKFNKWSVEASLKHAKTNTAKLDSIFLLLRTRDNYPRINQLSMDLLNLGGVYFRKNAFNNLVQSGDIRFIDEFDTKQDIINLYEYYKWVESFDEISLNIYTSDYYPYLTKNFDFLSGETQGSEVYESKLFKNMLGTYKRTNENRIRKYEDCLKEIEDYLGNEETDSP